MNVCTWRYGIAVAAFLLSTVIAALPPTAAAASAAGMRCRWPSPNDGRGLDYVFSENPMIIMPPRGTLEVSPGDGDPSSAIVIFKDGKPYRQDAVLAFTAPEAPGSYFIPLAVGQGDRRSLFEVCVVVPYRASARKSNNTFAVAADGQAIGEYRHPSRSGNAKVRENPASYEPPTWWFRITDDNSAFSVIPGLAAGDLVAATEDTGLKHTDMVPVCYPMWSAVHTLRSSLPTIGVPPEALKLISIFRAPAYNRAVGSNAFGRHIYGDAFDFYIDIDGIGKAADLSRDGRLDRRDAYPVVALIEDLQADGRIPMGGIGVYNSVAGDHVVTMHLDLRGHRATWGYVYSASGKRSEFAWQSVRHAELDRRWEAVAAERAAKENRKYIPPRREPLGR